MCSNSTYHYCSDFPSMPRTTFFYPLLKRTQNRKTKIELTLFDSVKMFVIFLWQFWRKPMTLALDSNLCKFVLFIYMTKYCLTAWILESTPLLQRHAKSSVKWGKPCCHIDKCHRDFTSLQSTLKKLSEFRSLLKYPNLRKAE